MTGTPAEVPVVSQAVAMVQPIVKIRHGLALLAIAVLPRLPKPAYRFSRAVVTETTADMVVGIIRRSNFPGRSYKYDRSAVFYYISEPC
jgi:hypothetical protein